MGAFKVGEVEMVPVTPTPSHPVAKNEGGGADYVVAMLSAHLSYSSLPDKLREDI